ncbi:MAG: SRPBCC family protein [Candidatus Dormibacteraeota bacterium]|nr:SRPBCC family protein [Candidatus Dormibacteraeota bacterium]
MSEAEVTVTIKAPARAVFDFVAEPSNTPRFMNGISRYDPIGAQTRGKGARFASTAVVAGKDFDVELEVTAWKDGEMMVATSRKGPKTRGTWHFEEFDDGTTDATLLYEYALPMVFKFVPGVNGIIRGNLERSLKNLKKMVEEASKKPSKGRATTRPGKAPSKAAAKPGGSRKTTAK